jgi:biotin-dependent carboxylase-like uncharacterized protein
MEMFSVINPGAYTSVQDRGRFGFQQMGIPITGVLDFFAYEVANLIVGNSPQSAVLEITLTGPALEVRSKADVAVTGADIGITLNGVEIECWRSFRVTPGDKLEIHQVKKGCRAYLAVTGGIEVPVIMGSRSTYVGGKIGGFNGRHLKQGDILKSNSKPLLQKQHHLPTKFLPEYPSEIRLRTVLGPQDEYFSQSIDNLFASKFMVSPKADRMGYRLLGPKIALDNDKPKSIVSEPSMPGGVQIPPDEQPIILLVEQTVGGYAKIVTVVSSDISKVAQATPGDSIQFKKVDLTTAHELYYEEKKRIQKIKELL